MIKPNNFDEVKVSGEYKKVELGGHIAQIIGVKEQKNRNGGDMVVVAIDFAKNDKQAGYFAEKFNNDDREGKKWPYAGTQYINVLDRDGCCSRSFKSFCQAVEDSNAGFKICWEGDFCKQFKGKAIGAVYGLVESEYNGQRRKRAELRWFTTASRALDVKVPDAKLLPEQDAWAAPSAPAVDKSVPF